MTYCRYMNNLVTPLALLLTGYIIHELGLKNLRIDRALGAMLLFRFIAAPAVCALFCAAFGVAGLARSVYIVEAAMPVVTQTVVASAEYGADEQFAAQGADRCSVSSVRACAPVCRVLHGLPWYLPALVLVRPVLCSPSGYAGGWGLHLWGVWGAPGERHLA